MLISKDYVMLYTSSNQSIQIINILKNYLDLSKSIIIDANAGIGGNSLFFCKYFNYVYVIDISSNVIDYLEYNLNNFNNKFIINDNCLDVIKLIKHDIIFFDPPWGGKNYKFQKKLNLYLNDKNINDIIEELYFKNTKLIALKAPYNFNLNLNTIWKYKIYNIYKANKINIIFNLIIYKK